ncbi:hypothetical protein ACIQPT_34730 [Streptomyces sp. NPDC091289]|uniref:hypothetical protein n=1 Tax=Streptomyces sp. NPDC091289 TaxID=3365989 RepID=UPI00381A4278
MPITPDRPADQLRAAAEKLREEATRAHRASPSPWAVTDEHVVRCADGMIVADRSGTDHPAERADLPYIALMHPGVGLALADWLDRAAVEHDATVHGAAGVWSEPGEERERDAWVERQTNRHALAVARQLLGASVCPECGTSGACNGGPCPLTAADEELEPVQLRWGLDDVMYGDDDTTTVLLSGPGREPYWVELDPERTAALRDALAGTAVLPAPADRAAILTEAADIAESLREFTPAYGPRKDAQVSENVGILRVADHLRRLATKSTPAHEHVPVTALDGDDRPAYDEAGRTWTHCGICGQKLDASGVRQPAPRIRCAHTDVLYGQCVRYLDDHDGDCQHEHQPTTPAVPEEPTP